MQDKGIIVGRHINGITLNDLEYLLNENGSEMIFASDEEAKQFLFDNGEDEEGIEYYKFERIGENNG